MNVDELRAKLRAFPRTHTRTIVTPPVDDLPALLWRIHGELSGPSSRQTSHGHPDVTLELTSRGDGLLTDAVQIGNYGPPETRRFYELLIGDLACVWVCDGVDFDLPTTEITFEIAATTPELLDRIAQLVRYAAPT